MSWFLSLFQNSSCKKAQFKKKMVAVFNILIYDLMQKLKIAFWLFWKYLYQASDIYIYLTTHYVSFIKHLSNIIFTL